MMMSKVAEIMCWSVVFAALALVIRVMTTLVVEAVSSD